ncbi:hypothetical protein DICVIV_09239 [Dictyocaulus viviparus]|uniref:Uncharacterized protein n=1 Tax=Dictyocaulus viviparus TaxID=29172 RepID=A0A0D8XJC7_DICVI|nr:hypothetical protein DICVIV_09239 [Dictyocaulus viviparus]
MSRQRRDDIQGFRGWAVILVILYVFYPKQFPNGYIGVDMYVSFYILYYPVFIVAMLLKSEDSVTLRTIGEFYQKR